MNAWEAFSIRISNVAFPRLNSAILSLAHAIIKAFQTERLPRLEHNLVKLHTIYYQGLAGRRRELLCTGSKLLHWMIKGIRF